MSPSAATPSPPSAAAATAAAAKIPATTVPTATPTLASGMADGGNRKRSWSLPGLKIDVMRRSSVGAADAPRSPISAGAEQASATSSNNGSQSPRPASISPRLGDMDSPGTPDSFVRPRLSKGLNPDLLTFLNSPF